MRAILFILAAFTLVLPALAAADPEWKQHTQLLPQYCKDRAKGGQSPEFSKWRSRLGDAFIHMHHYCDGIYAEQKARSTINPKQRKRWLERVIGEMQYVGRHCDTRCVLYPELHTRLGWALGESGQVDEAVGQLQRAIKARPKYTLAYVRLSDLYLKIKEPGEARKVLEAGLKVKPESRSLKRRLKKL